MAASIVVASTLQSKTVTVARFAARALLLLLIVTAGLCAASFIFFGPEVAALLPH